MKKRVLPLRASPKGCTRTLPAGPPGWLAREGKPVPASVLTTQPVTPRDTVAVGVAGGVLVIVPLALGLRLGEKDGVGEALADAV